MKKKYLLAILFSLVAALALTLPFLTPLTVDALVGYYSVLGLLGMAALEYRLSWKGLFGRS